MRIYLIFTYFALIPLFCFFAFSENAFAQMGMDIAGGGPALEISPTYPRPNEEFTVRYTDLSRGSGVEAVYWYQDGVLMSETPSITATFEAPSLGEETTIEARTANPVTGERTASYTLAPSDIDLIVEADTRAPYFYKGRRVPGLASVARITAVPSIFGAEGERIPAKDLTYIWSIDHIVVDEGPGKQSFEAPLGEFRGIQVHLLVEDRLGQTLQEKLLSIPDTPPTLQFYLHNPLLGLSENALPAFLEAIADEITVRAEPYFVDRDVFSDGEHQWSIDGGQVSDTHSDPQMLAIRKAGEGGRAEIGFMARNLRPFTQLVRGVFTLEF